MASWLDPNAWRQVIGQTVADIGNAAGIPELGWSEKLAGNNNPYGQVTHTVGKIQADYSPVSTGGFSQLNYSPYIPSPASTSGGTGGGSNNIPTTGTTGGGTGIVGSYASTGNSAIDQDYNQKMTELAGQQSGLEGQRDIANQTIDQQAGASTNEIKNTQTTAEQGANTSLQTAEGQGKTAMQQARDVYRQTQQANSAQLSALGISSSSVTQALAERLGVDTAQRIAGVTGSLQEVRQNTVNELGRIKTYYQGKIEDLTKQVGIQKAAIQNSFMQGLNQINLAKDQAATAKSQSRADLINQVQTQLGTLAQQQQQFEQNLQAWAAQKSAALTPIVQDPNYLNKLITTANTLNQQFSSTGLNFTPQVNVNAQGTMTGQISPQKKTTDELTNPFLTP